MKRIYKYLLPITAIPSIDMPKGAKILSIQAPGNYPQIWALVDPEAIPEKRLFSIYETGQSVANDDKQTFIGTVQLDGGGTVVHVFEFMPL